MDQYKLSFPFHSVDGLVLYNDSKILEEWFEIEDLINSSLTCQPVCCSSETKLKSHIIRTNFIAAMTGLKFIRENLFLSNENPKFVDCIGFCGSTALFAKSYGFKEIESIEFSNEGHSIANSVRTSLRRMRDEKSKIEQKIIIRNGSFQDYFSFDANVVYLNCTILSNDCIMDECTLMRLFTSLSSRLLAGSYLIVVTKSLQLNNKACKDLGLTILDCLLNQIILVDSDEYFLWILRTVSSGSRK
mmetsp:Transcript_12728/g.19111  ORF Transcript_12728/g.19111 Transcript_12728/m.19111 type:complete len:245 (+) Transcript_12728:14-748(+)